MLLNPSSLEHILKYISFFDDQDKENEGVTGKTEEEIIEQYIESFPNVQCFEINGDQGFVILEKKDLIGAFHLYLKKEFRTPTNALSLLKVAIKTLKETGCHDIYTLANGRNKILLKGIKLFNEIGEYKGFTLYKLI